MLDMVLRHRAVIHYEHFNHSLREVAEIYNIGKSTLARWVQQPLLAPPKARRPRAGHRQHPNLHRIIARAVSDDQYTAAHVIQSRVHSQLGSAPSLSTIYRFLRNAKLTFKRTQRTRQVTDPVPEHPFFRFEDPYDGALSIDESHFQASDSPRYGWALLGDRVSVRNPSQYQRVSLLLAVSRSAGVVGYRLVKGSVKATTFIAFLESLPKHQSIVLDNASIHRARVVKEYCVNRCIDVHFTPPYCPWYNPVEYNFSTIKAAFRRLRVTGTDFLTDIKRAVESLGDTTGCFDHAKRLWTEDKLRMSLQAGATPLKADASW